jgi:hypothetical protein
MRRFLLCLLPLVVAACSDSLGPHVDRELGPFDSYAMAPCADGIAHDIAVWHAELGDPLSITTRTGGDTTFVRVSFKAPPQYAEFWDGTVWQSYYWLPSWGYCMATRSVGLPNPYER